MPALPRIIVKIETAGASAFAAGLFLLGIVGLASGEFIANLQPIPESFDMPDNAALLNGTLVAALAAGILVKRFQGPAAALLAAYLSTWLFVAQLPQLCFELFQLGRLVSLLELAAVVAVLVILAFGRDARSEVPAKLGRAVYGCMLLVFAVANFRHHDLIASIIPDWVPFAAAFLWFTASINLAVGVSFLTGIKTQLGGAVLGITYASWVPVVHLPRVISTPTDASEWASTALAVTLAGAAWLIAAQSWEPQQAPTVAASP